MEKIEDRTKTREDAIEEMPRVISKLSFLSTAVEGCGVRANDLSLNEEDLFGLAWLMEDIKNEFEALRLIMEKEEGDARQFRVAPDRK